MRVNKILYIADTNEREMSDGIMNSIVPLRQRGLREIVFVNMNPAEGWMEKLSHLSIKATAITDEELTVKNILNMAHREEASFIAMNIAPHEDVPHRFPFVKKLIERTSIPILFEKTDNGGSSEKGLFDHIIFATDWSSPSGKALKYLLEFRELIGELDIVHVINNKLTIKDMRELKQRLADTRKECLDRGIDAEGHIYAGKTSEEIVRASGEYRGTLVVLGAGENRPKPLWRELLRGNAVYDVVRQATVSVFVIP